MFSLATTVILVHLLSPAWAQTLSEGSAANALAMSYGPSASAVYVVGETRDFTQSPSRTVRRELVAYSTSRTSLGKRLWTLPDVTGVPAVEPNSGSVAVLSNPIGTASRGNFPRLLVAGDTGGVTENSTVAGEGDDLASTPLAWLREGTLAFFTRRPGPPVNCPPRSKFCGRTEGKSWLYPAAKEFVDETGSAQTGASSTLPTNLQLVPAPLPGEADRMLFGALVSFPNDGQFVSLWAVDPVAGVVKKVLKLSDENLGTFADLVVAKTADGMTEAIFTLETRVPQGSSRELDIIVRSVAKDLGSVVWEQRFKASPTQQLGSSFFPPGTAGFSSAWITLVHGYVVIAAELTYFNSQPNEATPPKFAFSGGGRTATLSLSAEKVGAFTNSGNDKSHEASDIVILQLNPQSGTLSKDPQVVGTAGRDVLLRNVPGYHGGAQHVGGGSLAIAGQFGDGRNIYFYHGGSGEGIDAVKNPSGGGSTADCEEE